MLISTRGAQHTENTLQTQALKIINALNAASMKVIGKSRKRKMHKYKNGNPEPWITPEINTLIKRKKELHKILFCLECQPLK